MPSYSPSVIHGLVPTRPRSQSGVPCLPCNQCVSPADPPVCPLRCSVNTGPGRVPCAFAGSSMSCSCELPNAWARPPEPLESTPRPAGAANARWRNACILAPPRHRRAAAGTVDTGPLCVPCAFAGGSMRCLCEVPGVWARAPEALKATPRPPGSAHARWRGCMQPEAQQRGLAGRHGPRGRAG